MQTNLANWKLGCAIFAVAGAVMFARFKARSFAGDVDAQAVRAPTAIVPPATQPAANFVEPFSNGLLLTMSGQQIIEKFGPSDRSDLASIEYPGFRALIDHTGQLWHLSIKGSTKLHCGIGLGSAKQQAIETFGAPRLVIHGQYRLTFDYDDTDRISSIKIDPADLNFAPYDRLVLAPTAANSEIDRNMLCGSWQGAASKEKVIRVRIAADGTYLYDDAMAGGYLVEGGQITFTGPLARWNAGHALVTAAGLEFRGGAGEEGLVLKRLGE
ncbi:MAG TPA: hypothetical protein VIL86_12860 [Tepidisphaeraceae bacterium]